MYGLAQPQSPSAPQGSNYAGGFKPPLMSGKIPVPESDADLAMLLRQSKVAWDAHKDASDADKKVHVKAVSAAVSSYASKHPTAFAKHAVAGIEKDPNLKPHR